MIYSYTQAAAIRLFWPRDFHKLTKMTQNTLDTKKAGNLIHERSQYLPIEIFRPKPFAFTIIVLEIESENFCGKQ